MYTIEQRVFLVRLYWVTGSFKQCQESFRELFHIPAPSKSVIQKMVRKLETIGTLQTQHGGGRPAMAESMVQDVRQRLLSSPTKSIRRLSQETGMSYSSCQRAAKKGKVLEQQQGEASSPCPKATVVTKYQLIYFPFRGRAEPVRFLFKDNVIDYEDIVVEPDVWLKEWKPQMQFGQLPCLKDNDFQLVQSNAILRHLGRKHGLYGDTGEEAALIDMISDGVEDLRLIYTTLIYKNHEKGKDKYISSLPAKLQPFELLLLKNGADKSGCCVGKKKSFVDYNLADLLDVHLVLAPECLDDFLILSAFYKLMMSRPNISEYRQTDAFKKTQINETTELQIDICDLLE